MSYNKFFHQQLLLWQQTVRTTSKLSISLGLGLSLVSGVQTAWANPTPAVPAVPATALPTNAAEIAKQMVDKATQTATNAAAQVANQAANQAATQAANQAAQNAQTAAQTAQDAAVAAQEAAQAAQAASANVDKVTAEIARQTNQGKRPHHDFSVRPGGVLHDGSGKAFDPQDQIRDFHNPPPPVDMRLTMYLRTIGQQTFIEQQQMFTKQLNDYESLVSFDDRGKPVPQFTKLNSAGTIVVTMGQETPLVTRCNMKGTDLILKYAVAQNDLKDLNLRDIALKYQMSTSDVNALSSNCNFISTVSTYSTPIITIQKGSN
ncbi:hypothetical protein [Psittacicella hinzii]|uniref:LysM domain-containing protein n=1 Tax=Psittacicella hinzii TaxID=2028575 RepID=A0A3A1YRX0_9GAMM|nr:hypothetical protein [Psittacicella hinzii]RIY39680.1 hypothetical protein CKF58_01665 [Psittacicella hinzii]